MELDICNVCDDPCLGKNPTIGNNNMKETWRWLVAQALCGIASSSSPTTAQNITTPVEYTHTQPTIANNTSTEIAAANPDRLSITIQNNSSGNVLINLAGETLTGIVPTLTNKGILLNPLGSWTSPPNAINLGAITVYQSSGGAINTISVTEGVPA